MSLRFNPLDVSVPKISSAFEALSKTAKKLNDESDKLTKTIEKLDLALQVLNLGVPAWVQFDKWCGEDDSEGYYEVGYDKSMGSWGLCLRSFASNDDTGAENSNTWTFNGAPRELRIRAVSHVPVLIEALDKAASQLVQDLSEKNSDADQIAQALGFPAETDAKDGNAKQQKRKEAK
jgi:prefoldin subunit 5